MGTGVDLFTASDEDPVLVGWKEGGVGWPIWGPSGICVCRCQLAALSDWFLGALEKDHGAREGFKAFIDGLP